MFEAPHNVIGILGAGSLAGFLVEGFLSAEPGLSLLVSPRGRSKDLSEKHGVRIASSNQDVVDQSDIVVVCLPAAAAHSILQDLTFRPDQAVLSAVARLKWDELAACTTPASAFCSMMPGQANALGIGPSILYPADPVLEKLLGFLGPVHTFGDQNSFEIASTFGGLSGASFVLMRQLIDWYVSKGMDEQTARKLIAETLRGNATVLCELDEPLSDIVAGVATPGGITWQCVEALQETGGLSAWEAALDILANPGK